MDTPPLAPASARPKPRSPRAETSSTQPGTVFISYRRTDSSDVTGRIYDRLVASHGKDARVQGRRLDPARH
jgi:hypothetical protein